MPRLMRPPRSPSLPSATKTCLVATSPSWRGQRESNPYLRADNAASCHSTMSPSAWSQRFRHAGMVGSRGFEPRSARSERAASAYCATSRDGPSGWTRTTTTRVKSPGCCVDTTEGMERMTGFEPVPQGLEGPRATVTPHSLWFGLRVSNPSLHGWQRGMRPPHSGRTRTGVVHRPIDTRQFSKTPLFRAGGRQGIRTQSLLGRTGLRPVGGPSAPYRPSGDSARSRTRTHELWRLGSRYTTLPTSPHVSTVSTVAKDTLSL